MRTATCPICGKVFRTKHPRQMYCSKECRTKATRANTARWRIEHRDQTCASARKYYARIKGRSKKLDLATGGLAAAVAAMQAAYAVDGVPLEARDIILQALRRGIDTLRACVLTFRPSGRS